MAEKKENIAQLIVVLPMFMGALMKGSNFETAVQLSGSEARSLIYIYKHEGGTMSEYSKRVGLARGSFTAVADSLEEKGLVARVSASDDRRKCALMLSGSGKKIAREIDLQFKRHLAARLEPLSGEDLSSLEKSLKVIAAISEKL